MYWVFFVLFFVEKLFNLSNYYKAAGILECSKYFVCFYEGLVLFCHVPLHTSYLCSFPLPVFVFVLQTVPSFASVLPLSVHATLCIFLSASFHTFLDFSRCHLDLFVCWMSLTFAHLTELQLSVYFYIIILSLQNFKFAKVNGSAQCTNL